MHAMYIMDIAILCAVASYAARLQIIVNPPYNTGHDFIYPDTFIIDSDKYNAIMSTLADILYREMRRPGGRK